MLYFSSPDSVAATSLQGYLRAYRAQRVVTPSGAVVAPSMALAWAAWKMRDGDLASVPVAATTAVDWRIVG